MATAHNYETYVPFEIVTIVLDTTFALPLRGFRTAAAGDVSVVDGAGNTRVIPTMLAGETFRGIVQSITTSGTTVASPTTNIIGLR